MNLFERVVEALRSFLAQDGGLQPNARAFATGTAVVERTDQSFGIGGWSDTYAPEEYGEYLFKSNGVYACATLRADLLASRPARFYKKLKGGKPQLVEDAPCANLLEWVNPFWTRQRLMTMSELSLCLWGKNFWFVERGESGTGEPKEIWWARGDRVKVYPHPEKYIDHFEYTPRFGGDPLKFLPSETIWLRYPNPLNEFEGLSPIAAARLAADYGTMALQSNRNLFQNGLQLGGMLTPPKGMTWSKEQAEEAEEDLARRFRGVDRAHRWAVLRAEAQMQQFGLSAKEAEFIKGMQLSLEDICRAYKIPLDLMGGQRTYANYDASMQAVWVHAVQPEGRFFASELTEQYLPMFSGQADYVEFDYADISVLQEDRGKVVTEIKDLATMGVPLNKLLAEFLPMLLPEAGNPHANAAGTGWAWGDIWYAPSSVAPIAQEGDAPPKPEPPTLPAPAASKEVPPGEKPEAENPKGEEGSKPSAQAKPRAQTQAIEYGGEEHQRLFTRYITRTTPHEKKLGDAVAKLLRRQKDSVLSRLRQGPLASQAKRDATSAADEPFDLAQWIKEFRQDARPIIKEIVGDFGDDALDELDLGIDFNLSDPNVVRFMEQRTQRFARQVNETTWQQLKDSLAAGIDAGESIAELSDRVDAVMGSRIASSAETIARTEVVGSSNGGMLEGWRQAGEVVEGKSWLATLGDERTRPTHREAHGQTVALDEDFEVGEGRGPAPGQIGLAEEDCNCRCTMTAVLR